MHTDVLAATVPDDRRTILCRLPILLAVFLLLGGCYQDLLDAGVEYVPNTESSTAATTEATTPTTTDPLPADTDVQTLTGASEDTGEQTTSDPVDGRPPTIGLFDVVPAQLSEAGPAELQLEASDDVTKVLLKLDAVTLAEDITLADFPRLWEALSAKDNGPARTFRVVVTNREGLSASAEATLNVHLPQPGVEKCIFTDPDQGKVTSIITAIKYTKKAIYAVGSRDTGAGMRLTAWKLDPNTCTLVPGWPKDLSNWADDDALSQLVSIGSAVDVDADDNVVVAGNFLIDGVMQSYVALLTPEGSRLWQHVGQLGDEVNGVAAATGQNKNRIFVVGSRRIKKIPASTDGVVWIYQATNDVVFVPPPTILATPFTPDEMPDDDGVLNERARAVLIHPSTGNAMVVGEREFSINNNEPVTRAFAVQVAPLGGVVGTPWTSDGAALQQDALRSLATCDAGFVAGGWTRDKEVNTKPEPMMFWFEADGTSIEHRHFPQLDAAQLNGIACDRELKIVSAGQQTAGETDALVFTVQTPFDPQVWYEDGVPGDDVGAAVSCDPRGFCAWGGFRTVDGQAFAVVQVDHP